MFNLSKQKACLEGPPPADQAEQKNGQENLSLQSGPGFTLVRL